MFVPKPLKSLFISFVLLVCLLAIGLSYLLFASLPIENGRQQLTGLSASVTVNADKLGIPSIQANNRNDAFRVLGFLHARDRLFQMDLMRRMSGGRLAEVFGEKAINIDKTQRHYQLNQTAASIVRNLPKNQLAVLSAYVEGVNAFIAQAPILPPEFIALNYRPDAWRAEDSLLVALHMFQTLNGQEQDERMLSVMDKMLSPALVKFLTPDTDQYATVLVGGALSHRPASAIPIADFKQLTSQTIKLAQGAVDTETNIAGSNNWVVAGTKTLDGRAIIANDMHLKLNTPNIWFRAELRYGEYFLNGVTLPGLPVQIVGSNQYVAWGFTNATADLLDLVRLNINPDNNQEYLTPQGWRRFTQQSDIIKIKGGKEIPIELRSTIWGPVSNQPLLEQPVAIKWTALEPNAVDFGLLDMDKVKSVAQAMTVLNQAGGPPQNVVLADSDGHIGWTYMGRFPKRKGFDGLVSLSWSEASSIWDGFIPAEELPRLLDPASGFIATANNRTLGKEYPYIMGYNWALGYRAYRISELLGQNNAITEQDMLQIQLDTRSEIFDFYRDLALKVLNGSANSQIESAIRAWDGHMHSDSKGIALLIAFRSQLAEALFAKVVERCRQSDPDFVYAWREMETPLRALLTQRPAGVLPAQYQDDWDQFILQTLQSSAVNLADKYPQTTIDQLDWKTVNRVSLTHPLSKGLPMLATLLNIDDFNSDGCAGFCIKVLANAHGASERLVVSPAHPEDGILQMPGGQSGHPFSRHYRDQHPFWYAGGITPFTPTESVQTLQFTP
ncbi:penicillin acylase family protein [Methylomonas sp. AM2-LC]|uniref:penicillin acylase family protein n=1 Tax=Methylomonas sp. AM2-LC TaxID=3153301 RepID=UPI0032658EDA